MYHICHRAEHPILNIYMTTNYLLCSNKYRPRRSRVACRQSRHVTIQRQVTQSHAQKIPRDNLNSVISTSPFNFNFNLNHRTAVPQPKIITIIRAVSATHSHSLFAVFTFNVVMALYADTCTVQPPRHYAASGWHNFLNKWRQCRRLSTKWIESNVPVHAAYGFQCTKCGTAILLNWMCVLNNLLRWFSGAACICYCTEHVRNVYTRMCLWLVALLSINLSAWIYLIDWNSYKGLMQIYFQLIYAYKSK